MKVFDPKEAWRPYHVVIGMYISELSIKNSGIYHELKTGGINSADMRVKLVQSAKIASLAITNMLADV